MNILTDKPPQYVDIEGKQYKINFDFRVCLKTIMAFEDNTLTPQEKQIILLSNLYPAPPPHTEYAIREAMRFLNGGKIDEDDEDTHLRLYSFSKDANFIFAAFKQTHGIDLQESNLHWWNFLALFMDLGQDTTFCQLVSLRKRFKTGKATKEERAAAREMGSLFDVPDVDDRTLDEKEMGAEFLRKVEEARLKREGLRNDG